MAPQFEEFHAELRSVAGDLLAKDRAVEWAVLADAGWTGLEVAEDLGGAGATFGEVAIVCEEMGRAASANRYLGSAVLAVGVLNALQPSDIRDRLLSDVGSGALRVAVALGPLDFVPDAVGADRLLVVTTDADGVPVVVDAAGLTVTPQPVVDETRRLAAVSVDGSRSRRRCDSRAIPTRRSAGCSTVPPSPSPVTVSGSARQCFPRRCPTRRCATSSIVRSGRSKRSNTPAQTCW